MQLYDLKQLNDIKTEYIKALIYGKPMYGKTTFAATFPKALIISTDGNFKNLSVDTDAQAILLSDWETRKTASGVEVKESGWITFKQIVNQFIDNPDSHDRQTIVVDLIRDIYDMCRDYVLKSLGIAHESEEKVRGKVWNYLDSEFRPVLRKLMTSNYNVVLIAHEKILDMDKILTTGPELIRSVANKIETYSDIVARLVVDKAVGKPSMRKLEVIPYDKQLSGNRLGITTDIEEPTYNKIIEAIKQGEK